MNESSSDNQQSWSTWLFSILVWAFAIYFIVFVLAIFDECWLETFFITKHAPPWVVDALRTIYAPLLSGHWMISHTTTVAP
jgi:hypothetical protein